MNILFLRGFNNYFNRVIKKYNLLADYQSNSDSYVTFENINFNPNDGIATELVVGNENQKELIGIQSLTPTPLDWENVGTPDYCICYEYQPSIPSQITKIHSRWFVLESERLRSGQYRIALKRDVVAEHFNTIKVSPCFIEKGMVNNVNNTLLYNKESMTYNQIKDAEYKLKDNTESAWIVGYVAKNLPTADRTISTTILLEGTPVDYYDSSDLPFSVGLGTTYAYDFSQMKIELALLADFVRDGGGSSDWLAYQYLQSYVFYANSNAHTDHSYAADTTSTGLYSGKPTTLSAIPSALILKGHYYGQSDWGFKQLAHMSMKCTSGNQQVPALYGFMHTNTVPMLYRNSNDITSVLATLRSHAKTACTTLFSSYGSVSDNVESYNGKIVKYNNQYYTMQITKVSYRTAYFKVDANSDWTFGATNRQIDGLTQYGSSISDGTDLSNLRTDVGNVFTIGFYSTRTDSYDTKHGFDGCGFSMPRFMITLSPLSTETLSVSDAIYSNRNTTYDCPADIFAIPYGEVSFKTSSGSSTYYTTKNEALAIARAIGTAYGNGCYDLQVVPYCPSDYLRSITEFPYNIYELDSKMCKVVNRSVGGATPEPCSFVIWPTSSKGTFDISLVINQYDYNYSNVLNTKINNETTVCRLASPNYNGMFEFSIAKNNGILSFNVDYTYKPYMPYIHVNPDFKFMYGQDWDDARGLICGGDFSLSFINDYWQNYQNNNKNYQAIFDRQIQNMDVNNAIALEKQEFQATVGTITSAIGGAMGGAAAGATAGSAAGPWGALIGGVAGAIGGGVGSGVASAYGAAKDRDWLTRQQQEARSFAIDMYGYQLGNIQAMPYSLSRTESLTNNNKIWPILELYKPTDLEIDLLVNKIRYNGMSIMAVGNIQDYCSSDDFERVFIKGQLIRLESSEIKDDFHIADAIYQEINKGVYIPSGGL